jgi:hypothetical protein
LELYCHNHIWLHDVRLRGKSTLTVIVRIRIVCQATDNILSFRIMLLNVHWIKVLLVQFIKNVYCR